MKNLLINFLFCTSLFFASNNESFILKIDSVGFTKDDFFSTYSIEEWKNSDTTKKADMFYDWVKKEAVFINSKKLGFLNNPLFVSRIVDLENSLLVNETYNHLVGRPLINNTIIKEAMVGLKSQVYLQHLLISFSGTQFAKQVPLKDPRSKNEAYELCLSIIDLFDSGSSFDDLVSTFSEDPPAKENLGKLGWVSWGRLPYAFQKKAFNLSIGSISDPVLTDFGYHLILVSDKKPSALYDLSTEAIADRAYSVSRGVVGLEAFKKAASQHDSSAIAESKLSFNSLALEKIIDIYNNENKTNKLSAANKTDPLPILLSIDSPMSLFSFNNKSFGPLWLAKELKKIPPSQRPNLGNINSIKESIELIVLRKLAILYAKKNNIEKTYSFKTQYGSKLKNMVFENYLKELINSIPAPDSLEIKRYYNDNTDLFSFPEKRKVREIRVKTKSLADSLLSFLQADSSFISLATSFSKTNPRGGGLIVPFEKGKYNAMGQAAFSLNKGSFSGVLNNLDRSYSIVFLEEIIPPGVSSLKEVTSRIQTSIVRNNQDKIKIDGIHFLLNSYTIWISSDFFKEGLVFELF